MFALVKKVHGQGKLKPSDYQARAEILVKLISEKQVTNPGLGLPKRLNCSCNVANLAVSLFKELSQLGLTFHCLCSSFIGPDTSSPKLLESQHGLLNKYWPKEDLKKPKNNTNPKCNADQIIRKQNTCNGCQKLRVPKITSTSTYTVFKLRFNIIFEFFKKNIQ